MASMGNCPWPLISRIFFTSGLVPTCKSALLLPIPEDIRTETQALRLEIQSAREAVESLSIGRQALVWENWVQRWLLKFRGALDLGILIWILWPRPRQQVVRQIPVLAHTRGSSTDSDESSEVVKDSVPQKGAIGKGSWTKGRPARPSDFRVGK